MSNGTLWGTGSLWYINNIQLSDGFFIDELSTLTPQTLNNIYNSVINNNLKQYEIHINSFGQWSTYEVPVENCPFYCTHCGIGVEK